MATLPLLSVRTITPLLRGFSITPTIVARLASSTRTFATMTGGTLLDEIKVSRDDVASARHLGKGFALLPAGLHH